MTPFVRLVFHQITRHPCFCSLFSLGPWGADREGCSDYFGTMLVCALHACIRRRITVMGGRKVGDRKSNTRLVALLLPDFALKGSFDCRSPTWCRQSAPPRSGSPETYKRPDDTFTFVGSHQPRPRSDTVSSGLARIRDVVLIVGVGLHQNEFRRRLFLEFTSNNPSTLSVFTS